jgi:hypothetical protein
MKKRDKTEITDGKKELFLTASKLQIFYRENDFLPDCDKHDSLLEKCIGTYPYLDSEEEEIERKELDKEVKLMNEIKQH